VTAPGGYVPPSGGPWLPPTPLRNRREQPVPSVVQPAQDAEVVASATRDGAPLITGDAKVLGFMRAAGYLAEGS